MYLNLGSILLAQANEQPDAVVIRAGDAVITYAELDRAARGVATSLRQRGVEPGDKVALLVPNVAEFTIAYFGILELWDSRPALGPGAHSHSSTLARRRLRESFF